MSVSQIFGGSAPPKELTDYVRQIFGGSTPRKYLTDVDPPNVWGVYTPQKIDGCMSVKYLGGLHPQKN